MNVLKLMFLIRTVYNSRAFVIQLIVAIIHSNLVKFSLSFIFIILKIKIDHQKLKISKNRK
jgi:hypothetical protein